MPVAYRGRRGRSRQGQVWPGPLSGLIELKPPTDPILRSCEIAVTSCAGANGFVRRMLFGTPLHRPLIVRSAADIDDRERRINFASDARHPPTVYSSQQNDIGHECAVLRSKTPEKRDGLLTRSGYCRIEPAIPQRVFQNHLKFPVIFDDQDNRQSLIQGIPRYSLTRTPTRRRRYYAKRAVWFREVFKNVQKRLVPWDDRNSDTPLRDPGGTTGT
jgi:hypothetical protein